MKPFRQISRRGHGESGLRPDLVQRQRRRGEAAGDDLAAGRRQAKCGGVKARIVSDLRVIRDGLKPTVGIILLDAELGAVGRINPKAPPGHGRAAAGGDLDDAAGVARDDILPYALHDQPARADLRDDLGDAHPQALDAGWTEFQRVFGGHEMAVKAAVVNDLLAGETRRADVINPQGTGAVPLDLLLGGKVQAVLGDRRDLVARQREGVLSLKHPLQQVLRGLVGLTTTDGDALRPRQARTTGGRRLKGELRAGQRGSDARGRASCPAWRGRERSKSSAPTGAARRRMG